MRLVSLCPSITSLIFELGRGAQLVGRTRFCEHPSEGTAAIATVGGTKDPKLDRILRLRPDLVFLNREENRREDWQVLQAAGINCNVTFPLDVAGAVASISQIASALGAAERGAALIAEIEAVRASIERSAEASFAYLIWRKPWMVINGNTYISGLLGEAGWRNVFATSELRYPAVTAEELRTANPDRVMLSSEPFPFKEKHIDELSMATGIGRGRFCLVDGRRLSWHGSFTASGLTYAAELIANKGS